MIVLSIEADEEQKVLLLRGGADDYVTKPFAIGELAARCEAALRRYHKAVDKDPLVRAGPLTIDLVTRAVTLHGQHIALTRKEYHLAHACLALRARDHSQPAYQRPLGQLLARQHPVFENTRTSAASEA